MSGLLLLLASCAGSLLVVGLAMRRDRLNRFEGIGVALFVVVVACIGVGGVLSQSLRADLVADGRALVPCAMGPLLALSWRAELMGRVGGPVVGGAATVLLIAGLTTHAATLAALPGATLAVTVALLVAGVAAATAAVTSWRRARVLPSRLLRARGLTEAAGVAAVGAAGLTAALDLYVPLGGPALWAGLVGLGAALATTARAGSSPPTAREATMALGGALAAAIVAPHLGPAVGIAVACGVVLAHGALGQPGAAPARMLPTTKEQAMTLPATKEPGSPLVQALPPILDDASLRRPARPRVLARTPARRLVDAAVERAWRASPQGRGRPPVDVVGGDDVDVDGDAAELAEAISAVVDAALRAPQRTRREGRITVRVRAAPQTVSFEIDDDGGTDDAGDGPPGGSDRAAPPARPFLDDVDGDGVGLGLLRARMLVERHGGQLHLRGGGRGAVHLTLPRRVMRGPVGLA